MARLLPHLSKEAETRLIVAVQQSNDGYPEQLETLREWHEEITDEDIDAITNELRIGAAESRDCGRDDLDFALGADVCPNCGIDLPQHEYHCIRNGGTLDLTQEEG